MNREQLSRLAHADHPIAAPLDVDSVYGLLERGVPRADARVLDLGCGGAEWLLLALEDKDDLRAEGVDLSADALARAAQAARARGVDDRLVLHHQDASTFTSPHQFDLVLCVGATHAFGGLLPTLTTVRKHLAPGGRVIVGECYWEREPSPEAVEIFGELEDLATTVDSVIADGWVPIYGHVSTRHELDDYEWSWTGSLAAWALDNPDHPDRAQALDAAAVHRSEWLRIYRDCFGFVSLVLRDSR